MKILVISDTHYRTDIAEELIEKLNPDYTLHLGDMADDCKHLEKTFPSKNIVSVRGNNDFFDTDYPFERTFELEGVKIFMCHGHKYSVKFTMDELVEKANEVGAKIALYGHTHIPHMEERGELTVLNPGSVDTYGIIEIENGNISAEIIDYYKNKKNWL